MLPTRLSAVDEAAAIDVFCADKTGTLTRNELSVLDLRCFGKLDRAIVLALAALASSESGADPVDGAVRKAAARGPILDRPRLLAFVPFDPQLKRSEATLREIVNSGERFPTFSGEKLPTYFAWLASVWELCWRGVLLRRTPARRLSLSR